MNTITIHRALRLSSLFLVAFLTACTGGTVKDSSNSPLAVVEVVAYGQCSGAVCGAHKVETTTPTETLTGYKTVTNSQGQFFYDPYAKVVAPQDAMAITVPSGSAYNFYKLQFAKLGYKDVWLDYTPNFKQYTQDGKIYLITSVADMYLCRNNEADTDGDGICDAAEARYGTSPSKSDTDGDGKYDDQELFGTGSPFAINIRKLLHYNINVSNFEVSKNFYKMLGFRVLMEVDVDVTDPQEAQGLNLPPYTLKAAPMILGDGLMIDLIEFQNPFDPAVPHSQGNSIGLTTLSLKTDNIAADINALLARGIPYTVVASTQCNPLAISFSDPDGTLIQLTQVIANVGVNSTGETYIYGLASTNINVSDYERSLAFYQETGFRLIQENGNVATLSLQGGCPVTLTESSSTDAAYENLNHLGIARIAIETTNIEQDIAILQAKDIAFYSGPITPSGPLSILRYACFEDPDGTVIELVQYNQ